MLIAIGAWLVAMTAACKQAEPPVPGSEILGKARALSAQLCACADRACAQPVRVSWSELTGALSGVTFTEDQVEGLVIEDQRFVRCLERFEAPAAPPGEAPEPTPTPAPIMPTTSSGEPAPPS